MCDLCLPRRQVLAGLAAVPVLGLLGRGTPTAAQVAPGLAIHPRSDWAGSDRGVRGEIDTEDVRFLLVHHTAGATDYAEDDVPQLIRNIYDFHTGDEKRWPDVAYNFLIDRYGGVWEARDGSLAGPVRGDATGGNQGFSQLVCVMGTFSERLPTDDALVSLRATLAWLADRHDLDTSPGATTSFDSLGSNRHSPGSSVSTPVITGHRAMSQTSCPGDALFSYVSGELMADVSAARTGAAPSTVPVTGTSTASESPTTADVDTTTSESVPPSGIDSSTTSRPSTTDTVAEVPVTEDSTDEEAAVLPSVRPDSALTDSARTDSALARSRGTGGAITAWQGVGLASAGAAAAAVGLLAVRRRGQHQAASADVTGDDS